MRQLSEKIGLKIDNSLTKPTIAGLEWAGNSMYTKTKGLDKSLAKTRDVFTDIEEELIDKYCGEITNYLSSYSGSLINLDKINESALFDYDHQTRFLKSRETSALYFASMYERWKYNPVSSLLKNAILRSPKPRYL